MSSPTKHSVMGWCFKPMPTLELARRGKEVGLVAIEGISKNDYPAVKELGLEISLVGSHGFKEGPCNPEFRSRTVERLEGAIDVAVAAGCPNVITFTGMSVKDLDRDSQVENCLEVWKAVLPKAEAAGVTLCLEHLNSRDHGHPMKGHPGYFGDDVDVCFDMVRKIGSPNFKLLFDIYHVQIMNGDVIRRIRENHELIGHYHTAGNPGRAEIDGTQEIHYPSVIAAIHETGYSGYVAHEFIPENPDMIASLRDAVEICS